MSKYDWLGVRREIEFLFMYKNTIWGSNLEPRLCEFSGDSWRYDGDGFKCEKVKTKVNFKGDWRESLEKRPCSTQ